MPDHLDRWEACFDGDIDETSLRANWVLARTLRKLERTVVLARWLGPLLATLAWAWLCVALRIGLCLGLAGLVPIVGSLRLLLPFLLAARPRLWARRREREALTASLLWSSSLRERKSTSIRLTCDEGGIRVSTEGTETELGWPQIEDCVDSGTAVLIMTGDERAYSVPHEALGGRDKAGLVALVRRHVKHRRP